MTQPMPPDDPSTEAQAADDVLDLAAVLALDAVDEPDVAGAEGQLDASPAARAALDRFRAAVALMGAGTAEAPPGSLGQAIAAAASEARVPGEPTGPWAAPKISSADGFARVVARLGALLSELGDDEWAMTVPDYLDWTVRQVVAHVVAVDRITLTQLGLDNVVIPPGTEGDHVASARPIQDALAELPVHQLRDLWIGTSRRLVDAVLIGGEDLASTTVTLPSLMPLPLRVALVARIFEVWTHAEDLCRATGRPLVGVDPAMLRLMCPVAVRGVPYGLLVAGRAPTEHTVRVVLTGPGGGAWSQPLGFGEAGKVDDALLVLEALDFCRLAASRLAADEIEHYRSGDDGAVQAFLAGATMFAA